MKLEDAARDYLNYLRHEQGVSPNTVETYRPRLRAFLRWMAENGYPEPTAADYTTPILRRYVYALSDRGNRPRTVRACFDALRSFARFLLDAGAIQENPTTAITLPKLDAAIRLHVADEDVAALFVACERQRTLRLVALSRAVLSVLAYGGLRRDEVCNLLVEDVNLAEQSILIRSGKGRKSRRVFVCTDAVNALREWLAVREKKSHHDFLFSIDRARRMHHRGIAALMETLKATAGLRNNEAIKPHGLRHWCATNLLRNGANLRDVQQFLGHSSIQITANYLHSNEEQLRSICELTALQPKTQGQKGAEVVRLPFAEQARSRRIARRA